MAGELTLLAATIKLAMAHTIVTIPLTTKAKEALLREEHFGSTILVQQLAKLQGLAQVGMWIT